jgi:predicted transposase/invertase (TIGR01784 family)
MVSVIHHPHDKLFRLSLEEPKVAQEFLAAHLPPELLKRINIKQAKLENCSFIDDAYKGTEADIVFTVPMDGATCYIYLLLEHQSEIDPFIAFRLLVYRIRIMERHLKQYPDQPLPLIYSMVIYNGEQPWETPIDLFALFGPHEELAKEWFFKPTQLLDFSNVSDEDIRSRQWSGLIEFALKNRKINDFKAYIDKLIPWIRVLEQTDPAGFYLGKIVIRYVLRDANAQGVEILMERIQDNLSPRLRGEAMTLADELEQIGRQKGIHQGIHQGEVALFTRQLKRRFYEVPECYFKYIEQADAETLLLWGEKILDAKTLEEIFTGSNLEL